MQNLCNITAFEINHKHFMRRIVTNMISFLALISLQNFSRLVTSYSVFPSCSAYCHNLIFLFIEIVCQSDGRGAKWILKFSSSVHLCGFGDMKLLQGAIMNNSIHCSFNHPIKNFILADYYQIYYFSKKTSIYKLYNIFRKVGGYG